MLDWTYPAKDIIDETISHAYHGKMWGRSSESIFTSYCITMGSGFPKVGLDDNYIEAFRAQDVLKFNVMMDMVVKFLQDCNDGNAKESKYFYVVIEQYLCQSVKHFGGTSLSNLAWHFKNGDDEGDFMKLVPHFLQSVLDKRDRYRRQIDKIYDRMMYLSIDYLFNIDPTKIAAPSKI